MRRGFRWLLSGGAVVAAGVLAAGAVGAGGGPKSALPVLPDGSLQPQFTSFGGAKPLSTTKTVDHWFGTAVDPHDGVTYGYNMVGVDPATNGTDTVGVDIIPLNLRFADGTVFDGSDVVAPVLASPVFQANDYSTTPFSTGGPGELSAGNNGVQLEDATMRSQFNKVGSGYHLFLSATTRPTITLDVPQGRGVVLQSARGVPFGDVNIAWFAGVVEQLYHTLDFVDPTRLPLFLTNNAMMYSGSDPANCCTIGFHGASDVLGHGTGSGHGNGNQEVQTWAFASYTTPGTFNARVITQTDAGPLPGGFFIQDIHALSHELAEWADDPFVNNKVEPWLTPTAPQYGCTDVLETGDPVVGIGFDVGHNAFAQGPAPNGQQIADGYYHPEDEVFLPWFVRTAPNTISQPEQGLATGRYTLMGGLNPFSGFRQPATGC